MARRADGRPLRCVFYGRRSSRVKKGDASRTRQWEACGRLREQLGAVVAARYFDLGKTGANLRRREMQAMLQDLAEWSSNPEKRVDLVISEDLCRASRDAFDTIWLYRRLAALGIELWMEKFGKVDEFSAAVKAAFNAEQRTKQTASADAGRRLQATRGFDMARVRYGYRAVPGKSGERVVDPDQAAIVREVFESVAAGMSASQVARELNRRGVPAPRGKRWSDKTIFRPSLMTGMIFVPFYWGDTVYGRSGYVPGSSGEEMARGPSERLPELSEGRHSPIVSRDLRDRRSPLRSNVQLPRRHRRLGWV